MSGRLSRFQVSLQWFLPPCPCSHYQCIFPQECCFLLLPPPPPAPSSRCCFCWRRGCLAAIYFASPVCFTSHYGSSYLAYPFWPHFLLPGGSPACRVLGALGSRLAATTSCSSTACNSWAPHVCPHHSHTVPPRASACNIGKQCLEGWPQHDAGRGLPCWQQRGGEEARQPRRPATSSLDGPTARCRDQF